MTVISFNGEIKLVKMPEIINPQSQEGAAGTVSAGQTAD
jgi:hypothetical protein